MIDVCTKMRWTYDEYMAQPTWFVDGIIKVWMEENKQLEKLNSKIKQ
jgi:hypothetical protein